MYQLSENCHMCYDNILVIGKKIHVRNKRKINFTQSTTAYQTSLYWLEINNRTVLLHQS